MGIRFLSALPDCFGLYGAAPEYRVLRWQLTLLVFPQRNSPRASGAVSEFIFVGLYDAAPEYRVPQRRLSLFV